MSEWSIRRARSDEIPRLQEIERAAGRLFAAFPELDLGDDEEDDFTSAEEFAPFVERGQVFVAADSDGRAIGWAGVCAMDGEAHLFELDVDPDFGRRGLGRALVEHTAAWAAANGYEAITLTTFRDVPFNRPFYESAGYAVVEEGFGPEMAANIAAQEEDGLDFRQRCVMRRRLT